jgi:hypothetical protein
MIIHDDENAKWTSVGSIQERRILTGLINVIRLEQFILVIRRTFHVYGCMPYKPVPLPPFRNFLVMATPLKHSNKTKRFGGKPKQTKTAENTKPN